MPNPIKYNTDTESNALNKGNFWIGTGDVDKGPTSTSGYYNGITPPPDGYTIYIHKSSGGPSIQVASDDSELIRITNTIAETSYTTIGECFDYFDGQSDKMVVSQDFDFRKTEGLVLDLDAKNISSYPRSGNTWKNIGKNSDNSTLVNNPTFTGKRWINFDGSNDYATISNTNLVPGDITSLTVGGIWKRNGDGANYETVLHQSGNTSIGNSSYWFGYDLNNKVTATIGARQGVGWSAGQTTIDADIGKWFYTVASWDGSDVYVYINGELIKSYSLTSYSNPGTVTRIGASGDAAGYLANVGVSRVHINSNKYFTQDEVLQNYYGGNIVTDGLIRALDFSNLVCYESGSTNGYDLTGNDTFDSFNTPTDIDDYGGGIACNNTDEFIALADQTPTDYVSAECWFRRDNNDGGENIIFNKESSWEVKEQGGGLYWALMANNKSWFWDYSNADIAVGEVCQIVLTYDGDTVKFYKNGIQTDTYDYPNGGVLSAQTSCYPKLNSRSCGRTASSSLGNMSYFQFRVYDRAISAGEVLQNYNAQKSKFGL